MNQDIKELLKQLPQFQADCVFKDKLQRQIFSQAKIKPSTNWRAIGLFSVSLAVVVLAVGGYQALYQRQILQLQQINEGEKLMLPKPADTSGKGIPNLPQLKISPCTENSDPCDMKSCNYDLKRCQKQYVCPEGGYIDCMPQVVPGRRFQCSRDYIDWAENNCPDFEGVTY